MQTGEVVVVVLVKVTVLLSRLAHEINQRQSVPDGKIFVDGFGLTQEVIEFVVVSGGAVLDELVDVYDGGLVERQRFEGQGAGLHLLEHVKSDRLILESLELDRSAFRDNGSKIAAVGGKPDGQEFIDRSFRIGDGEEFVKDGRGYGVSEGFRIPVFVDRRQVNVEFPVALGSVNSLHRGVPEACAFQHCPVFASRDEINFASQFVQPVDEIGHDERLCRFVESGVAGREDLVNAVEFSGVDFSRFAALGGFASFRIDGHETGAFGHGQFLSLQRAFQAGSVIAVAKLKHLDVVLTESGVGPLNTFVIRNADLVAVRAGAAVAAGFGVQPVKVVAPFRTGELGAFGGLVGVGLGKGAGAFLGVLGQFFLSFFVKRFGSGFRSFGLDGRGGVIGFGIVFHDFLNSVAFFVELDVLVVKFLIGESDGGGQGEGYKKEIKEIFFHIRDLT